MDTILLSQEAQKRIYSLIEFEKVKILNKNLFISLPSNLLCAIIIFFSLLHNHLIYLWFYSVIVITLVRFAMLSFYHSYPQKVRLQGIIFTIGTSISAMLWGILASLIIGQAYVFQQVIIIIIIAGVTAGGVQSLNAHLVANVLFIVLIVLPLCIWLFLQNNLNYALIGTIMSIYLLFMISLCIRGYKLLVEFLRLRFENQILVDDLSISNQKLVETNKILEHRERDIVLINKMNELLQTSKELVDAYDIIIFTAQKLFYDLSGGLILHKAYTNNLEAFKQWGDNPLLDPLFTVDDCWAVRRRQTFFVDDKNHEILCKHFKSKPTASICLPLFDQEGLLGIMVLYSMIRRHFTEYQLQLASSFSEVIQLSLANISLRETLYRQSTHDHLTGLYNRRYLDELLTRELQVSLREKKPLSIAMLDLDKFKQFNDEIGHEAGDAVLKVIANLIKQTFRETDIPCRYGGEEFLIVLLNSPLSEAFRRLEAFRKMVKKEKVFFNNILLPPMTVSIGVAMAPMHGKTVDTIINAADVALYVAKHVRDKTVKYKLAKQGDRDED